MENAHPFLWILSHSARMWFSIFSFLLFLAGRSVIFSCSFVISSELVFWLRENFYISLLRGLFEIGYLLREQKFFAFANRTDRAFCDFPNHFALVRFGLVFVAFRCLFVCFAISRRRRRRTKPASFISHSKYEWSKSLV